jgi:hypothetical protein
MASDVELVSEYDRLKAHYDTISRSTRLMNDSIVAPSVAKSLGALKSVRDDLKISEYTSQFGYIDIASEQVELDRYLDAQLEDVTTLAQRTKQLAPQPQFTADLMPLRVALRAKFTKRCNVCQTVLIKPDIKVKILI